MCPKLESDEENLFKLLDIIEVKNDRNSMDKVEMQEKLFGRKITSQMDIDELDCQVIDQRLNLKTCYIAGGKSN